LNTRPNEKLKRPLRVPTIPNFWIKRYRLISRSWGRRLRRVRGRQEEAKELEGEQEERGAGVLRVMVVRTNRNFTPGPHFGFLNVGNLALTRALETYLWVTTFWECSKNSGRERLRERARASSARASKQLR
jgi:hypothetical protein